MRYSTHYRVRRRRSQCRENSPKSQRNMKLSIRSIRWPCGVDGIVFTHQSIIFSVSLIGHREGTIWSIIRDTRSDASQHGPRISISQANGLLTHHEPSTIIIIILMPDRHWLPKLGAKANNFWFQLNRGCCEEMLGDHSHLEGMLLVVHRFDY